MPDTKLARSQHELSDRHKSHMQRTVSRLQRDQLIKTSNGLQPTAPPKPLARPEMRRGTKANVAGYGYGERDDMIGFIRDAKRSFTPGDVPTAPPVEALPQQVREGIVGAWEVTQAIRDGEQDIVPVVNGNVKVEEEEGEGRLIPLVSMMERRAESKRERGRTPDAEDLVRFRVQEKTFPLGGAELEEEEDKKPSMGFKKRKIGGKKSRVSMVL
jgi:hypothetical protein